MKTLLTIIVLFIVSIGIGIVFAEIIGKDFICEETEPQYVDTEDIMEDAIISNDPNIELTFDGDGSWTWWSESAPDVELQFAGLSPIETIGLEITMDSRDDFRKYLEYDSVHITIGDKTLIFTADEFLDKLGFERNDMGNDSMPITQDTPSRITIEVDGNSVLLYTNDNGELDIKYEGDVNIPAMFFFDTYLKNICDEWIKKNIYRESLIKEAKASKGVAPIEGSVRWDDDGTERFEMFNGTKWFFVND